MLRYALAFLAAPLLLGCADEAGANTDAAALELTGRVVDAADILSPEFEDALTDRLAQLEGNTQVQLVVATTPDLQGQNIADFSLELARNWGIGSSERDDGLLLVIAPADRTARIEVGYGLEASVTNDEAEAIMREAMVPRFRDSDYEAGVDAGVARLIEEVTPLEQKEAA